ncbi:MAG: putative adenine specific methylase [Pseudomonadota bacterium]|jgi:16S rRNA (guanine966-N2)-methyltransferase
MKRRNPASASGGEVRVIGGTLRGRKLPFPAAPGLRPTPDRVRETLFNWLAPVIREARCLDLFAGSGALGVEALSRGAREVVFVDRHAPALAALQGSLQRFAVAPQACPCIQAEALPWLRQAQGPFDVVFIDPPFDLGLQPQVLAALADPAPKGLLAPGAWVYVEQPRADPAPLLPAGWRLHRQGTAGDVGYYLLQSHDTDVS